MDVKTPTVAQLIALRAYADEHGRTWKRDLNTDWQYARAQVNGEHSPELQQVRNTLGPSWLAKFRFDTDR